ncbi:MAG: hypothetical protein ACTHW2_07725 [Tissierella sp.]|uniref:hypothetical protein n=1 Tax=Tissierella sp. TaxID=41274 RepID=UPI003F96BBD8
MSKFKCTKILSLLLIICIISSSNLAVASSMGISTNDIPSISKTKHTKESITNELYNLGFTTREIEELFQEFPYDENIPLLDLDSAIGIYGQDFASDSDIQMTLANHPGQRKRVSYNISTNWVKGIGYPISIGHLGLSLSKAQWAKIIIKKVGWKITALAGAIALAVSDMFMGPNGVRINVTYTWTYGDNSMVWFWAPTGYSAFKY